MMKVAFLGDSLRELGEWYLQNRKTGVRVSRLIEECRRTPYEGIGKPEPLKGDKSGLWSRRIDDEHRMLYKVEEDFLFIYSLRGHYDD